MNLKLGDTKPLVDFIRMANANEADVRMISERYYKIYYAEMVYGITPSYKEENAFAVTSIGTVDKGKNPYK